MNVLSLFDGISCGQLAFQRAGIKVDKYYASEIDKHAIKVTMKNFPDTIQLGSVLDVVVSKLGWLDFVIGGSPCQGFSFAGKQLNFEDVRSKLLFEFVRIVKEAKEINSDVKFLLENVKMKKQYQDIISGLLGVEPIEINSALVSAQNRKRLYWTNIEGVGQPEDRGILLKDILISGIGFNYDCRGSEPRGYYKVEKSGAVDASYAKGIDNHGQRSFVSELYLSGDEIKKAKEKYKGKTWSSGNRMGNMSFPDNVEKKSKSVISTLVKGARETIYISDEYGIRKLHPIECERLQTLPDDYTEGISNTQRYKSIGNGWTVDVISHILSFNK